MDYIEEKVERIKGWTLKNAVNGQTESMEPLNAYALMLRSKLKGIPEIANNMYIYFETNYNKQSILAFKMTGSDSYVIYTSEFRKNKTFISLKGLNGRFASTILSATARDIKPLIENLLRVTSFEDDLSLLMATVSVPRQISRVKRTHFIKSSELLVTEKTI